MQVGRAETVLALFSCFVTLEQAAAQGVIVSMNTGAGQTIISEFQTLAVDGSHGAAELTFKFGFATEETVQPSTLLDSLTITLQTANQTSTAVYLTADANGLSLAPTTAMGVPLDPNSIQTSIIPYPSLQPVLPMRTAYQVVATIPSQFNGQAVKVFFDLYDNMDLKASQAWYSELRVVEVPEPVPLALAALATVLFWAARGTKLRGGV